MQNNTSNEKKFYISDLHFGHRNVIGFDHRPFMDVDDMDRCLIQLWNGRVQPEDTVYVLGDFCYKSERAPEWYLRQLRGHKILIIGNHDGRTLENPKAMHYFEDVSPMMHVTEINRSAFAISRLQNGTGTCTALGIFTVIFIVKKMRHTSLCVPENGH